VSDVALTASHENKSYPLLPDGCGIRQLPDQFSWIDQRLVRDRHITRCRCEALRCGDLR
jgi:hypothetical protein